MNTACKNNFNLGIQPAGDVSHKLGYSEVGLLVTVLTNTHFKLADKNIVREWIVSAK